MSPMNSNHSPSEIGDDTGAALASVASRSNGAKALPRCHGRATGCGAERTGDTYRTGVPAVDPTPRASAGQRLVADAGEAALAGGEALAEDVLGVAAGQAA